MATATTSTPVKIQTQLFINGEFVPAESGKTALDRLLVAQPPDVVNIG